METKRKKGIIQLMRNRIIKKYSFVIASIMILFLALNYSASASAVKENVTSVWDAQVVANSANVNFANITTLDVRDASAHQERSYIQYDLLNYTNLTFISSARACVFLASDGSTTNISSFLVRNNLNLESTLTWNNQPCGVNFDNATACNITVGNEIVSTGTGYKCFNVTYTVNREVNRNHTNVTIALRSPETANLGVDAFNSERAASNRPYMEVTFCNPNWTSQLTTCTTANNRTKFYTDSNSCGTLLGLPADNGTLVFCDYCLPNWNATNSSCTTANNFTETYSDNNTCCAKTGLGSDCTPPVANGTKYFCDFCLPNWQDNSTSCGINKNASCATWDNYTRLFSDNNTCCLQTGLGSDCNSYPINNGTCVACDFCTPNWTDSSTNCGANINVSCVGTFDNYTKLYHDNHSCCGFTGLSSDCNTYPTDNGTCNFCNYCTPTFTCSLFASCVNMWKNCLNVSESNQASCCFVTHYTDDCLFSGNLSQYRSPCGDMKTTLFVHPDYPYVDVNSTINWNLEITINGTKQDFEHLFLQFPTANATFNWTFVNATQDYTISFLINEEGDYPFVIWSDYPYGVMANITGTLIVRRPFYINLEVFEITDKTNTSKRYINNFAYVTAEFAPSYMGQAVYNYRVEQYGRPIGFKDFFNLKVFHSPYVNGQAQIKLWERNKVYGIRLIDGNIAFFEGAYSHLNITKLYGTNIYLGSLPINSSMQQNQTIQFYLTQQEFHPYQWLVNVSFVIAFIIILIFAVWLVIIGLPIIAWYSAITLSVVAIILRILIWLNYGF